MPSEPGALPSVRPSVVLLGVDSGGSHTSVAIGDAQGRVLARAEGPGSAMRPGGAERSAAVIFDVAGRAATEARVSLPAICAVVGAAGAGSTPAQVASLAPHVLNAAREGEPVAQRIVEDAAAELLLLLQVIARHFPGNDPIDVSTAGGLLRPGSPLLAALRVKVGAELPRARFADVGGTVDAPVGALRLAAELVAAPPGN